MVEVARMTDKAKVRRHAERLQKLVASVVRTQIKDPRLGMLTITDARLTADLREATVFYTVLGDAVATADTAAALESAKGMVRSTVGKAMGLRHSPSITWVLDTVTEHVAQIDELLVQAKVNDAEVQRLAAAAEYAGDAQPYRVDEDEEESAELADSADGVAGERR